MNRIHGSIGALCAAGLMFGGDEPARADDAGGLGEIVVTTRKLSENLQDVPLAISAFTSDRIARDGMRRIDDVARMTPGLTFDLGGFPNDTRPSIRGLSAERGRPSVAVLLDGQDVSGENLSIAGGTAGLNVGLVDLERIEVVKGPQSTLYGRNAFAGAINYVSRRPSMEPGARASVEIASGGLQDYQAAVTGPIVDGRLAFRVNGARRTVDGYWRHPLHGGDLGSEDSTGGAVALLFTPTDSIEVLARYQYSDDEIGELAAVYVPVNGRAYAPGETYTVGAGPFAQRVACPPSLAGLTPAQVTSCTRGTYTGPIRGAEGDVQTSRVPWSGAPMFGMDMTQHLGSLQAEWKSGAGTFTYLFGWQQNESDQQVDGDYSDFAGPSNPAGPPGVAIPAPLSLSVLQRLYFRNRHTNHELRWRYESGPFAWLLGAQYFQEASDLDNAAQFWLRNPASNLGGPPFFLARNATADPIPYTVYNARDTEYLGLFGSVAWQATERLRLTGEVRANRDDIEYRIPGYRSQDVTLNQYVPRCLPGTQGTVLGAPGPGRTVIACARTGVIEDRITTPRFTAEYRVRPELLAYASYAKGFKPGGFNTNEVIDFAGQEYRAEKLDAYEIGVKSSWLERRLVANVFLFHYDYTDQQIGVQLSSTTATGQVITTPGIVNAAAVRSRGLELELDARATEHLTLGLGYAYTDAVFDEFVQGPPPPVFNGTTPVPGTTADCGTPAGQTSSAANRAEAGNVCADYTGKRVGKTPKHTLNLLGSYRRPLVDSTDWLVELQGFWKSKRYVDETNMAWLEPYWLLNAKAGVESEKWAVTAYVDNLLDEDEVQSAQRNVDFGRPEGFAPGRAYIAYLPRPRTYGVRLLAKF